MDSFAITESSLEIAALLFEHLTVNEQIYSDALTDKIFSTAPVYKLVQSGIPFREAYQIKAGTLNKKKVTSDS